MSVRIIVVTGLNTGVYEYSNMGDVAMLQVGVRRLLTYWPSARIDVITEDPHVLARYCPGAKPLSRASQDLWVGDNILVGRVSRFIPDLAVSRLSRMKRELGLRWPTVLRLLIRLKLSLRDRATANGEASAFLEAIEAADLLVVCGSGGFTDSCRDWNLSILNTMEAAIQRGLPVALFGQGMGPLNDSDVLSRARTIFPTVTLFSLRGNRGGESLLQSLGVTASRIMITGDEAIELAYEARSKDLGHGLGVNLRVAFYSEVDQRHVEVLKRVLQEFAQRYNAPIIPLPIAFEPGTSDDPQTIRQLLAGFDDQCDGGLTLDTPLKIIEQAGHCRIVVTGAHHAAVFALSQGIPAVCLAKSSYYISKFLGLQEQFGQGCETVNLDDPHLRENLTEAVERAWQSAERVRLPLLHAAQRQIELSRRAYDQVREFVNCRRHTHKKRMADVQGNIRHDCAAERPVEEVR